jgi:F-type H+-transporting ATPase subunit a
MKRAFRGGLGETAAEPSGRAARPEAASSVAPISRRYGRSLRPCLGTTIAPRQRALFRQALLAVTLLALALPAEALAKVKYHPEKEFELHDWVPIHLGSLNLSINKAVVYLLIGSAVTILLGLYLMRVKTVKGNLPGRRETIGEQVYEIAQTQIAEQGLPSKAIGRWFPYVASLFLFIWTINMLGFLPLPITGETWHHIPVWGIYAATASLSVTLALSLLTFVFTHVEGIRWNGPIKYFKSWIPDAPKPALVLIVPIEILSQFMRLISLAVRLFANMLAGHMLILVMIGLIFVLENVSLAVIGVPVATLFYIFEVVIVCTIQAFIFAALSAIYIGSAIEPEH